MQKSNVGGILSIVAGALGLLGGLLLITFAIFAQSIIDRSNVVINNSTSLTDQQLVVFLAVMYGVLGAVALILGVLGILGGIFSLQRKHWGWALAGAIAGVMTFLPLGVVSVVFIAMGRSEFNKAAPAATPQPQVGGNL